jgi:predicted ATP-dependent endonuclease of OLD family
MRLVSFRLAGYRRFADETTVDLSPPVVAIVGPNEAGKSSLLNALSRVGSEEPFPDGDFSGRERPYDVDDPDEIPLILSAEFVVEDEDRERLAGIPGAEAIKLYRIRKWADGDVDRVVVPEPERPIGERDQLKADLRRASRNPTVRKASEREPQGEGDGSPEDGEQRTPLTDLLASAADSLEAATAPKLADDVLDILDEASQRLLSTGLETPKYVSQLPDRIAGLAKLSRDSAPARASRDALQEIEPPIHLLGESARELKSDYDFDQYDAAPEPLENLLAVAEVSFEELKSVAAEPGRPKLTTLKTKANRNLERSIRSSWRQGHPTEQGEISVAIDIQGTQLQVWPYNVVAETHSRVEERSEGLRSFLSLLAFTTRYSRDQKPILLIDEAEMHLHYAAQAELVEVFTREELAAQIIYTTHSAGCLPDDLGSAVRVVETTGPETSTTRDGFWADRQSGFSPLLLSMGASALAFTPTRAAVMAEGPSDALLLPQLFRIALSLPRHEPLGFQVAPGIAWVPDEELFQMDVEAAKVVYLLDSDEGGSRHKKRLRTAGIPEERIFRLRTSTTTGLSVEDFVAPATYVASVNFLLEHMRQTDFRVRPADIKGRGIAQRCEKLLDRRGIKPLPKPRVAEEILRQSQRGLGSDSAGPPLLAPGRKAALVSLYRDISAKLDVQHLRPQDIEPAT